MIGHAGVQVGLDAGLVEEAVLLAAERAGADERRRFRAERDAIYTLHDQDAREAGFRDLHDRWFERLHLGQALRRVLDEQPLACDGAAPPARCFVLRAAGVRQQGADLHEAAGGPVLVVRLTPRTLLDPDAALPLLRREILHVSDMLDPAFGYGRTLPGEGEDPARDRLIRDRYLASWNVSVDGRLVAQGMLPADVESTRREEFHKVFLALTEDQEQRTFDRLFRGPRPRHEQLCALASGRQTCPD